MPARFTSRVVPLWKGLGNDCIHPHNGEERTEALKSKIPLTFPACRRHYHNICDCAPEKLRVLSILSWRCTEHTHKQENCQQERIPFDQTWVQSLRCLNFG